MSSDNPTSSRSWLRAAPAPRHACRGLAALILFAALGLGLCLVGPGCWGTVCLGIGFDEGLTVAVDSPDGFADGLHEVAIEADGVPLVFVIEFNGGAATCTSSGQEEGSCTFEVPVDLDRRLFATVERADAHGVSVNLYYTDGNSLAGGPEVTHLRISRGGKTLVEATMEPDYARQEVNGEGCGIATSAQVNITIAPARASSPP